MKNLSSILLIDSESTSFGRTNLFRELPSKFWFGHQKKGVKIGIQRMQNEGQTGEENVTFIFICYYDCKYKSCQIPKNYWVLTVLH